MQSRCGSWPLCSHSWRLGLVSGCIMTVEAEGSMCSLTASGVDRRWDSVEPTMEIYEMISCEHVLPTYTSVLKMWLSLRIFLWGGRSPAGMIEGTPQLHASAWKVSSACVAPVNLPITDPCEMNQHNGNSFNYCGFGYYSFILALMKKYEERKGLRQNFRGLNPKLYDAF